MADEIGKGLSFFAGVIEATATVFLTTLDDCLWLIPFVAQAPAGRIAVFRGGLFVATLVTMAAVTSLVAVVLDRSLSALYDDDETFLVSNEVPFVAAGAILCWSLAGYLYYRSWRKRQQRRQARESLRRMPSNIIIENKVGEGLWNGDNVFDSSEGNGDGLNYGTIKPDGPTETTTATPTYLRQTSSLSCDTDVELSMEMVGDMIPSSIRSFVGENCSTHFDSHFPK